MPRWTRAAKTFTAFARRWGLNAPPAEVWSGVIPVAQIDKHWIEDRLDMWGLEMQQGGTAVAGNLASCSLVAGRKEVLVHRVGVTYNGSVAPRTLIGHLFTPLQGYNPAAVVPALVFPWLQPVQPGEPARLAESVGVIGDAVALQVVIVNGLPHTSIGPVMQMGINSPSKVHWDSQDPPYRVKPFQLLTFQSLTQIPVGNSINISFWYTERDPQGDVG